MVRTRLVTVGVGRGRLPVSACSRENNIDLDLCYYYFSTDRK